VCFVKKTENAIKNLTPIHKKPRMDIVVTETRNTRICLHGGGSSIPLSALKLCERNGTTTFDMATTPTAPPPQLLHVTRVMHRLHQATWPVEESLLPGLSAVAAHLLEPGVCDLQDEHVLTTAEWRDGTHSEPASGTVIMYGSLVGSHDNWPAVVHDIIEASESEVLDALRCRARRYEVEMDLWEKLTQHNYDNDDGDGDEDEEEEEVCMLESRLRTWLSVRAEKFGGVSDELADPCVSSIVSSLLLTYDSMSRHPDSLFNQHLLRASHLRGERTFLFVVHRDVTDARWRQKTHDAWETSLRGAWVSACVCRVETTRF
jgi:hypothetical protein